MDIDHIRNMPATSPLYNAGHPRLWDRLREFVEGDPTSLAQGHLELNFADAVERLTRVHALAKALVGLSVMLLPKSLLEEADAALLHLTDSLKQIGDFAGFRIVEERREARQVQAHTQMAVELAQRMDRFENAAASAIAFLAAVRSIDPSSEASSKLRQIEGEAVTRLNTIRDLERDARAAVGPLETARYGAYFGEQAEIHRGLGGKWLRATGAAAFVTVAAGVINLGLSLHPDPQMTGPGIVQLLAAKIIVFSIVISATVWCAKVYLAHRHNYVVNRHRQNSLNSFKTFTDVASDEATKDAVLIQALPAIFAQQPSGYSNVQVDQPGAAQIIEVLKSTSAVARG